MGSLDFGTNILNICPDYETRCYAQQISVSEAGMVTKFAGRRQSTALVNAVSYPVVVEGFYGGTHYRTSRNEN